jgi:ABC-2 type transport system ATP-binding protein
LVIESQADLAAARDTVASIADGEVTVDQQNRSLTAPVSGGSGVLVEMLRRLDASSVKVLDVALRRPTLDDVFLTLTGHGAEDAVESTPEELKVSA